MIAALERMGRRLQARRELDQQTALDADSADSKPGKPVAKIGSYTITQADFEEALESLPPQMQDQMTTREARRQFLDQMIGRELLFRAAVREGLDSDASYKKQLHELEKDLLAQLYSQKNIAPNIAPDTSDLMMYYRANSANYDNKPFDQVRDRVVNDYISYISQKAVQGYIDKLMEAEPVQVFEENLD
jgi:peptidyl-prolyl cis-trans isomerase C